MPVAVARAFNHIGPGQRPSFVVPSFAAQLALSLLWAFYAGILIGVGIWRSYAPIRLAGIVLIRMNPFDQAAYINRLVEVLNQLPPPDGLLFVLDERQLRARPLPAV